MKHSTILLLTVLCLAVAPAKAQTLYINSGQDVTAVSSLNFSQQGTLINGSISTASVDSITVKLPNARYVGGDISMLTKYETQKATYKDRNGKTINDLIAFVKEQGWNTLRLRLFVTPANTNDKAVIQDLDYVKTLGRRIKEAGLLLMLDFHYSDTWADPGKQWTPSDWLTLSSADLNTRIYEYTRDCLQQMVAAGAVPDFIQTGNEISYGMLWGKEGATANRCYSGSSANWSRFTTLLKQAGKACREVCPRSKIIIHTERAGNPSVLTNFYDQMKQAGVDYDVIGLSYYPYFHGKLNVLETALAQLEQKNYGKRIQIVETGYPTQWSVPGTTVDYTGTYPLTVNGQKEFTKDLITLLRKHPLVEGLSWWYPEACAAGCNGDLKEGWYNAGLFDNSTGVALDALYELQNFKLKDK